MSWLLGGLLALVVPSFTVLVFMSRKDGRETMAMRDLLDAERKLSAQYHSERDIAVASRDIAEDVTKQERKQRIAAESARDRAEQRATVLLRAHLKDATDDEIREITAAAFAGFDGVSPLPRANRPASDQLIDPFPDVPPP